MRYGIIYIAINRINNKCYIGQTIRNLEVRKARHLADSKTSELPFHRAIRKYGNENFEWNVLEKDIDIKDVDDKEIFYINEYSKTHQLYNVADGGKSGKANKKLSFEEVNQVLQLLKTSDLSINSISKEFGVSKYAISDINRGKSWKIEEEIYPIRHYEHYNRLTDETVDEIIDKLLNTNIGTIELAKMYDINKDTIVKIMKGSVRKKDNLVYPLREINFSRYNITLNKDIVKDIYNLLLNTDVKFTDIATQYNVAPSLISAINLGRTWIDESLTYPLRKR